MTIVPQIVCILLGIIFELLCTSEALHIAVVGAGASGISSAKNAIDLGHTVEIFEKSDALGGAWYYKDEVGKDKYNVDIHSPLYESYRTNMPFQVLQFPDNYYPENTPSYPSHKIVWNYLNRYAEKYNITNRIKYLTLVEKVLSLENNQWEITVRHLETNSTVTSTFDSVFVCTGVCSSPFIPKLKGAEKYKGQVIHSRDYRKPDTFQKENVLVIGIDPSGHDIVKDLRRTGTKITRSYMEFSTVTQNSQVKKIIGKAQGMLTNCFAVTEEYKRQNNISSLIGNVKRFTGPHEVEFENGKRINFTVIIYATGYKHSYPFLDASTGIQVKNNHVEPLYKNVLNIEHHTMAFIGITNWELHFRMYDLQARFALAFISGIRELPPKPDMMKAMPTYPYQIRTMKDCKARKAFSSHQDYYFDLSQTAHVPNVRVVYSELYANALKHLNEPGFRNYKYVVNGNTFDRVKEK
ncbi:senecionine N-oxygenase-like [Contarinia nasturtii]|uniref:senecionine N-oxygenase-like n=1 Tax=Contarinia nasturtii TaxID=265458 RepID=UPI0012D3BCB2|nr:senecionine N-oxygenase-like [Contarinia nasturtii]